MVLPLREGPTICMLPGTRKRGSYSSDMVFLQMNFFIVSNHILIFFFRSLRTTRTTEAHTLFFFTHNRHGFDAEYKFEGVHWLEITGDASGKINQITHAYVERPRFRCTGHRWAKNNVQSFVKVSHDIGDTSSTGQSPHTSVLHCWRT